MEFCLSVCLLFSVMIICVHFLVLRPRKSPFGKARLPPGPKPLPIVGNLFDLGAQPHRSLAKLSSIYGPIMTLRLGQVDTIIISSPEMARQVLYKHDAVFANRAPPEAVRVQSCSGFSLVWLPPAQRWRNLRKICNTQLFTPQRLDACHSVRRQKVRELLDFVSSSAAKGAAVDVGRQAFVTTLNLLSRSIFSVDLTDMSSESSHRFRHIIEGILEEAGKANLSDYFPILAWIDPQGIHRRCTGYFKKLGETFDKLIDRRLSGEGEETKAAGEKDFLDELLNCPVQEDGSKFDRRAVKTLLTDIVVAGSDTTSSTVEWAMAELLRCPRAMANVREEIARVIGFAREVEESDISSLPYLQAVVKETLRLHPPAPLLIPRMAGANTEVHGYEIPQGTRMLINAWAIGRDGGAWAEREAFSPERFLGEEAKKRHVDFRGRDLELIPFGAGRRICPGLPLAIRMVHLMLASLLQRFEWGLPEGMGPGDVDMTEKFGVTLIMASPLKAVAVPVLSTEVN